MESLKLETTAAINSVSFIGTPITYGDDGICTQHDRFRTPYSQFLFFRLPYAIDLFQSLRMASSQNTKAQPNFLTINIWIVVVIGFLERLGILFFDRLALSGVTSLGRKGYTIELYRISGKKTNGLVAQCRIGGFVNGRLGSISTNVFALGKLAKPEAREKRVA